MYGWIKFSSPLNDIVSENDAKIESVLSENLTESLLEKINKRFINFVVDDNRLGLAMDYCLTELYFNEENKKYGKNAVVLLSANVKNDLPNKIVRSNIFKERLICFMRNGELKNHGRYDELRYNFLKIVNIFRYDFIKDNLNPYFVEWLSNNMDSLMAAELFKGIALRAVKEPSDYVKVYNNLFEKCSEKIFERQNYYLLAITFCIKSSDDFLDEFIKKSNNIESILKIFTKIDWNQKLSIEQSVACMYAIKIIDMIILKVDIKDLLLKYLGHNGNLSLQKIETFEKSRIVRTILEMNNKDTDQFISLYEQIINSFLDIKLGQTNRFFIIRELEYIDKDRAIIFLDRLNRADYSDINENIGIYYILQAFVRLNKNRKLGDYRNDVLIKIKKFIKDNEKGYSDALSKYSRSDSEIGELLTVLEGIELPPDLIVQNDDNEKANIEEENNDKRVDFQKEEQNEETNNGKGEVAQEEQNEGANKGGEVDQKEEGCVIQEEQNEDANKEGGEVEQKEEGDVIQEEQKEETEGNIDREEDHIKDEGEN